MPRHVMLQITLCSLLIGLPLGLAEAQGLPRAEIVLAFDIPDDHPGEELLDELAMLSQEQIEAGEYWTFVGMNWIDDKRLAVEIQFSDMYDIIDLLELFEDPLIVLDPEANPDVELEFVDFSGPGPGQVAPGSCVLTTGWVERTEATLSEDDEPPALNSYSCQSEDTGGGIQQAQLRSDGEPFDTVMTGTAFAGVTAIPSPRSDWMISFTLDEGSEEAQYLADYTAEHIGDILAIVVDNRVLSAPRIQASIVGGAVITGDFTAYEARLLAAQLKGGALPVSVQVERVNLIFVE